jgi:hypothetical protein
MIKPLDVFPADLTADQIRELGRRATKEKKEALAKAIETIADSHEVMNRADDTLAKDAK